MANLIFDRELNDFARKYLDKNYRPTPSADEFSRERARIAAMIGERLLYHPGIAFKVYGENIPLAVLLSLFGAVGVESLLEQGALRFILWTPLVTYSVSEIKGVMPLQSGNLSSGSHSDPEQSAAIGLGWSKEPLSEANKKNLLQKVVAAYLLPPTEFAARSAQFGHEGYEKNKFVGLGLPKSKNIEDLTRPEREKLCGLATQALEVAILSHFQLGASDGYELATLSEVEAERLASAGLIEEKTDVLFGIERLPDFGQLIADGAIDLKDIPKLRSSPGAEKFRVWIQSTRSTADAADVSKEYLDAITKGGPLQHGPGKFLKTVTVATLSGRVGAAAGAAVGAAIAGIHGAVVGVVAGGLAQPVIDSSLSLLDTYFLEGLTKGWTPRHYLRREIVPLILKARGQAMPGRNDSCYCGSGKKFKHCCIT